MLGDIIILQMCTKNYDQMMYGSWDMWRMDGQRDGRMDGWKKGYIEVCTPPKNCGTTWYLQRMAKDYLKLNIKNNIL